MNLGDKAASVIHLQVQWHLRLFCSAKKSDRTRCWARTSRLQLQADLPGRMGNFGGISEFVPLSALPGLRLDVDMHHAVRALEPVRDLIRPLLFRHGVQLHVA